MALNDSSPANAPGSLHRGAPGARHSRNKLLGALPAADIDSLAPHLEHVQVDVHQVLAKQNASFTHVYFPQSCVISLVNRMSDGSGVEVGTIGNEGMAGLPSYLEADASESETFCQIPGDALRMPVQSLIDAADHRPAIRRLLNRYMQAYMIQVAQCAACNRLHDIEQRCARWLLMTHDRVDGAESFPLKHEFLALMLGVRRAGVTTAAGSLQDAGLIQYRRGVIRVIDRNGLEAASCECYGVVRRRFEGLMH
jgi:CRP-like cAMP-binding protein